MTEPGHPSGEDRLIARYFKPLASEPGALALTDDAAFMQPPDGCDLVVTADAIVAGVHFLAHDPPDTVAQKALRVNLSDLAAKGAKPLGFLLTLALPPAADETWLAGFADGLRADILEFGCALYGGDTVATPGPVTISVTMIGAVPQGQMVKRTGAHAGDRVMVTGTIGDAVLGLAVLQDRAPHLSDEDRAASIARYRVPRPRTALAEALRAHASAAMDVSDGLAGDLAKLCKVSGVGARIDTARVPLSTACRAACVVQRDLLPALLSGGDDYEVLCTVRPDQAEAFTADARTAGVAVTDIGEIVAGAGGSGGVQFMDAGGRPIEFAATSFSHF